MNQNVGINRNIDESYHETNIQSDVEKAETSQYEGKVVTNTNISTGLRLQISLFHQPNNDVSLMTTTPVVRQMLLPNDSYFYPYQSLLPILLQFSIIQEDADKYNYPSEQNRVYTNLYPSSCI